MGRLLEIARACESPPRQALDTLPLSTFATVGQHVRLWSDVLGQEVCFASDDARPTDLPAGVPVYWARELIALWGEDGCISPKYLRRIHEVKTTFGGEIAPDETTETLKNE